LSSHTNDNVPAVKALRSSARLPKSSIEFHQFDANHSPNSATEKSCHPGVLIVVGELDQKLVAVKGAHSIGNGRDSWPHAGCTGIVTAEQ
jgi:hypothetical protein